MTGRYHVRPGARPGPGFFGFHHPPMPRLVAILLLLCPSLAGAAEELPLWEAGVGVAAIDLPAYRGASERQQFVLPVPYLIWRGERLRVDRDSVRSRLLSGGRWHVDLSLNGSLPVDSDRIDARRGMPDLRPTVEVGPALNVDLWTQGSWRAGLRAPLRIVFDTRARHVGEAAQLRAALAWRAGGARFTLQTGPVWGSRRFHGYFYDVQPQDALPDRPAYEAPGGFGGWQTTASTGWRIGRLWLGAFARHDRVGGAVFERSPLVDTDGHWTVGVAGAWVLRVSRRPAAVREEP